MKAQYVYENISFKRGKDPIKSMGLGHYWKHAVDLLVAPLGDDVIFDWDIEDTKDPEGTPTIYLRTFVKIPGMSPAHLLLKWAESLIKPKFGGPPLGPRDEAFLLISEKMKDEGKSILDEDSLFYFPERDTFYRTNVNKLKTVIKKIVVTPKFKPPVEKYPGDDQGIVLDMAIWYQEV